MRNRKKYYTIGGFLTRNFNSGALNTAVGAAGSILGQGISGGLSTGAGNAIQGLGDIAGAIPGPWGAVAGAALKTVGGLVNRAFGSQINDKAAQAATEANLRQGNIQFSASDNNSLLNQSNFGLLGNIDKSTIGKDGWFSSKAADLTKRLNEQRDFANRQALGNFDATATNIDSQNDMLALSNYHADGGPLFNPTTREWSLNGKPVKYRYNKPFGYTIYGENGFAINYNKNGREIGRKLGTQTPTIQDPKGRRNLEEQEYFNRDKELADSVRVISQRYGLNPNLVASRLAREGVDEAIGTYNTTAGLEFASQDRNIKGSAWGLDDFYTDMQSGLATLQEPWVKYKAADYINEHGRHTKTATFENMGGIVSATAAELKGRRDKIKKNYPNMSEADLDAAASASFRRGINGALRDLQDGTAGYMKNYSPFIKIKALGGDLGSDFTNGLVEINNGGTHEENIYEGVPMGRDNEGTPNLVEEGEAIFNNYVFSNRLLVPQAVRQKYRLSKNKNMTFADAAKHLSKESKERPNDPISKRGLQDSLRKLQEEQENIRQSSQKTNSFSQGGPVPQYLQRPTTEYNWDGVDTMFNDFSFPPSNLGTNIPYSRKLNTNIQGSSNSDRHKAFTQYALGLPNTHNYWTTLSNKTGKDIPYLRANYDRLRNDGKLGYVSLDPQVPSGLKSVLDSMYKEEPTQPWQPSFLRDSDVNIPLRPQEDNTLSDNSNPDNMKTNTNPSGKDLSWLRYAPVVGAAIGLGQNIFSKPDYSSANALFEASRDAGTYIPVSATPIGDYLAYNPFDRNYYINKLNAESGATKNALINQSAGNRASAIASLLAADYNAQSKLGDLARQAEEYNIGLRERVATFNRGTNQFNSESAFRADATNATNAAQARAARMSGIANAMQVRDAIDARRAGSFSANLTNLFNSIGDIGREEFSRNMIMTNPALYYSIDSRGRVSYKNGFENLSEAEKEEVIKDAQNKSNKKSKAKGGYLTIKG